MLAKFFPVDGFGDEYELGIALFDEVKNAKEISKVVKSGTFDVEMALMNPKTVISLDVVRLCAFKAIAALKTKNGLVTKTLHSEIIFNCSPKTNINEAFRRFGANDASTAILVASLDLKGEEENASKIRKLINGREIEATNGNLCRFADLEAIRKYYKLDECGEELKISSLEEAVLTRIGTREVM